MELVTFICKHDHQSIFIITIHGAGEVLYVGERTSCSSWLFIRDHVLEGSVGK